MIRLGKWLGVRRNFMLLSIFGLGGGSALLTALVLFPQEMRPANVGDWILWSSMCLVSGYIWGFLMWQYFETRRKEWGERDV